MLRFFGAPFCSIVVFAMLSAPGNSGDKKADRAAQIEAEIAKLDGQLKALREELYGLGKRKVDQKFALIASRKYIAPPFFKIGDAGRLTCKVCKISQIINEREAAVHCIDGEGSGTPNFILRMPTAGLADDRLVVLAGVYEVVETHKYKTRTFFVVEEIHK